MSARPIAIAGEPVLHRRAAVVGEFDADLAALVDDMTDTMDAAQGVGLAAPQIGVDASVFVWRFSGTSAFDTKYGARLGVGSGRPSSGAVVNPSLELTWDEGGVLPAQMDVDRESEGCLSFPGYQFPVRRATEAVLSGFTPEGAPLRIDAVGWLARIFQHEFDHLQGVLYVDRLVEPWASEARAAAQAHGWGIPGAAWRP